MKPIIIIMFLVMVNTITFATPLNATCADTIKNPTHPSSAPAAPKAYQAYAYSTYPPSPGYSEEDRKALAKKSELQNKRMIADLKQAGLIRDTENLSFNFSNRGLIVNGKKQSDSVFQRFKKTYAKDVRPGDNWVWSWHSSNQSE